MGLTVWWAVWLWRAEGSVDMCGRWHAAMTLGIVFSFVVDAGLMGLVFFSARKDTTPAERERRSFGLIALATAD